MPVDLDLRTMSDAAILRAIDELEARRPGTVHPGSGLRPRRRPWTYFDVWRLEALVGEAHRRGLRFDGERTSQDAT